MSKKDKNEELKTEVGKQIVRLLADEIFTVDGTPTVTVNNPNIGYRNKPLSPGAEFMLKDAYVGARGNLIFILSPADGQDYTIELDPKKIDDVFVDFGGTLGEKVGIKSEKTDAIVRKLITMERNAAEKRAEELERQKFQQTASIYNSNPLFGRF